MPKGHLWPGVNKRSRGLCLAFSVLVLLGSRVCITSERSDQSRPLQPRDPTRSAECARSRESAEAMSVVHSNLEKKRTVPTGIASFRCYSIGDKKGGS